MPFMIAKPAYKLLALNVVCVNKHPIRGIDLDGIFEYPTISLLWRRRQQVYVCGLKWPTKTCIGCFKDLIYALGWQIGVQYLSAHGTREMMPRVAS
jgi:hypothetical protein